MSGVEREAGAGAHTPLPWHVSEFNGDGVHNLMICAPTSLMFLADMNSVHIDTPANAELIVRAVNAHADLLAALQEAMIAMSAATVHLPVNELPRIACNTAIAKARAAIARATGA